MTSKTIYTPTICSCVVCRKQFSTKGIHSHYLLSHTDDGNNRAKVSGSIGGNKTKENREPTKKIPKNACRECGVACFGSFCNRSCAAIFNNRNRTKESREKQRNSIKLSQSTKPREEKQKKKKIDTVCKFSYCSVCKTTIRYSNNKTCSPECRSKIFSETAKNNPKMGGNKNTRAYGWYISPIAGRVYLESSYEYKVAQSLDNNTIKWVRPTYLKYGDKKYFPDFYLPDYDVYLDPKNDFLIIKDSDKINSVMIENNTTVLVLNKNQLSWEAIQSVLGENYDISTCRLQSDCSASELTQN